MLPPQLKAYLPYLRQPAEIFRNFRRWRSTERVDTPFVFILGPGRSGTTLLDRILLNHSRMRGFPIQTKIFSARPIHDYARFSHYLSQDVFDRALAQSQSLAGFLSAIHTLSFDLPSGGYFVEKTPEHAIHLRYLMDRFPAAKFLFTLRDPRDAFCSGRKDGFIPQAAAIPGYLHYLEKTVEPMLRLAEPDKQRLHIVRYETFTQAPLEQLQRLMAFLNLSGEEEQQLAPAAPGEDWRAGDEQFARLTQPVSPATVGRWQTQLSSEEQAAFRQRNDLLSQLGYPVG